MYINSMKLQIKYYNNVSQNLQKKGRRKFWDREREKKHFNGSQTMPNSRHVDEMNIAYSLIKLN